MIRRKPEFQSIDLSAWPNIAWTELDVKTREAMKRRIEAVERYARGERVKDIEKVTGVNRRQIYRWLDRGLAPHPDGRIFGFRALLAHVRVNEYVRVSPVNGRPSEDGSGKAGAFALFLERFPMLARWLLLKVKQRRVSLEQVHTDGRLQTRLVGLHALHSEFLWQCRSLGLTAGYAEPVSAKFYCWPGRADVKCNKDATQCPSAKPVKSISLRFYVLTLLRFFK